MTGWLPRGLRVASLAIAALAWLDPAVTRTDSLPVVAVLAAPDGAPATLAATRAGLAGIVRLTAAPDPAADAWVVIAGPSSVLPEAPEPVPVSVVVPASPARGVEIARVVAPSRAAPGSRARVGVTLQARALAGTATTVVLRSGALEIDRATHRWTAADERATLAFEPLLADAGVARFRVELVGGGGFGAVADLAVDVDDRRLPVLVVDGRPSWMTTFVRRALQADPGLEVTALTRIARGLAAGRSADGSLTGEALDRQAVAVVGAPDALGRRDVEALERFARGGGSVLLVPDAVELGAARRLLPARTLDERLLDSAVRVGWPTAPAAGVWASELALPRGLLAGAAASGHLTGGAPGDAALVVSPLGAGRLVYAGTLDAWRFRDREAAAFDRAWRALVRDLGEASVDRVTWRVSPRVARPGEPLAATLGLRDAPGPGERVSVEARMGGTPIRLRPAAMAATFTGALNAPTRPGVFAVSVRVAGCRAPGRICTATTHVIVAADAAAAIGTGSRESRRAAVEAGGGVVVESGQLNRLHAHLRDLVPSARAPHSWFPMRSAWWLLPFALSLGGEWWLRRRAGLR